MNNTVTYYTKFESHSQEQEIVCNYIQEFKNRLRNTTDKKRIKEYQDCLDILYVLYYKMEALYGKE